MNYELLLAAGGTLAVVVLAFLYARASNKAALADQLKTLSESLSTMLKGQRQVTADKEEYIRELEKTVIAGVPAGKLAERLNRLFAANRSGGAPGKLPPSKPGP